MTVAGRALRANLNNPQVPLTSANLVEWLTGGPVKAGVLVSENRVWGLSAWFRGVTLLASTMASIPLPVRDRKTRKPVEITTILDDPNPRQTPFEFRQTLIAHAVNHGTAYALKEGIPGYARKAWPIHPSRVRPVEVARTDYNPEGLVYIVLNPDGTYGEVTSSQLFRLPYMSLNGITGVSPLQMMRESFGVAIAAEDEAGRFYGQGSRIGGVLQTDNELDETVIARTQARWSQRTAGPANAGKVVVLDSGLKFQQIGLSPADAQLMESRKFGVVEISRILGLPPHLLGDVERSTSWGTGIEAQVNGLIRFTLRGWLTGMEQRFNWQLLPGGRKYGPWECEHDLHNLGRGDLAAMAQWYHQALTDGWLTRNEVRSDEGREPINGLDEPLVPSNLTLVLANGEVQPLSAAALKPADPKNPDPNDPNEGAKDGNDGDATED